jgi:hypothetical protein
MMEKFPSRPNNKDKKRKVKKAKQILKFHTLAVNSARDNPDFPLNNDLHPIFVDS